MITSAIYPDLPEWLHELYPFRTRLAQIGQYRMSFVDEGPLEAPVLLPVHGNPTWSFLFRDLIKQAREHYRVIAPDLIGFGLSEKPVDPSYHTLVRHIENLSALIDDLRLKRVTLVGHGWGGPIALGYAAAHPDNVTRLVLTNTWSLPIPGASALKMPWGLRIANAGRIGSFLDSLLSLSMASSIKARMWQTPSDWVVEAYKYPFPDMKSRAAIRAFSRMFFEAGSSAAATLRTIHDNLKNVSAPADILFGTHDPVLTRLPAYLLRDALRNAREPVFLDSASHFLPEDDPAALADTVLRESHEPAPRDKAKPDPLFRILS